MNDAYLVVGASYYYDNSVVTILAINTQSIKVKHHSLGIIFLDKSRALNGYNTFQGNSVVRVCLQAV